MKRCSIKHKNKHYPTIPSSLTPPTYQHHPKMHSKGGYKKAVQQVMKTGRFNIEETKNGIRISRKRKRLVENNLENNKFNNNKRGNNFKKKLNKSNKYKNKHIKIKNKANKANKASNASIANNASINIKSFNDHYTLHRDSSPSKLHNFRRWCAQWNIILNLNF